MNALIDVVSARVLYWSTHVPVITFLAVAVADTECAFVVNMPNYPRALPELKFPVWKRIERTFVAAPVPDAALAARAAFAGKKAAAFTELTAMINLARAPTTCALTQQAMIYAAKRREADRLIADPQSDVLDCPYVLQHAELAEISVAAAAREIALKARLADDVLLRSEYFRLKYFKLLRETESLGGIDAIVLGFKREMYGKN